MDARIADALLSDEQDVYDATIVADAGVEAFHEVGGSGCLSCRVIQKPLSCSCRWELVVTFRCRRLVPNESTTQALPPSPLGSTSSRDYLQRDPTVAPDPLLLFTFSRRSWSQSGRCVVELTGCLVVQPVGDCAGAGEDPANDQNDRSDLQER